MILHYIYTCTYSIHTSIILRIYIYNTFLDLHNSKTSKDLEAVLFLRCHFCAVGDADVARGRSPQPGVTAAAIAGGRQATGHVCEMPITHAMEVGTCSGNAVLEDVGSKGTGKCCVHTQ